MNQRLIVIDGKTYNSVNEMPPDVRAKHEQAMAGIKDTNSDGFPDFVEGAKPTLVSNVMKFVVDGKEYNSLEDLPPEMRAKYEQAMGAFDQNRNGIPDFVEGMIGGITNQTNNVRIKPVMTGSPPRSKPITSTQTIEPESSSSWLIALGIILLLGMCVVGAGAIWYFFLR